jgi:hypothetical protein
MYLFIQELKKEGLKIYQFYKINSPLFLLYSISNLTYFSYDFIAGCCLSSLLSLATKPFFFVFIFSIIPKLVFFLSYLSSFFFFVIFLSLRPDLVFFSFLRFLLLLYYCVLVLIFIAVKLFFLLNTLHN